MKKSLFYRLGVVLLFVVIAWHCKRELPDGVQQSSPVKKQLVHKTNPYSLSNLTKVAETLNASRQAGASNVVALNVSSYPQYVYYRINPANFSQGQFSSIGNDTSNLMMDFPFGEGSLYGDTTLTEASIAQLRDGYLYGIAPYGDSLIAKLQAMTNLQFQSLDTLVLLPDSSTTVQSMALRQAGFDASLFGICLLKKPHGYVRYMDNDLNRMEPVRGMKVWGLVGGIPVSAYTDANGYYEINYRFSLGTIMGTLAQNKRVNIRPLDTHGSITGTILRIIVQFATGSININGWVGSCNMSSGKDFNFTDHTQTKFWCQILNAYYFHDQYCQQENIYNAPDKMVCYAQWRSAGSGFGSASTPMLGHINYSAVFAENLLNKVFGGNVNLSVDYPSIFNVLTGVLPDMTIGVSETVPVYYNSRLAQTAFHELGHASQFRQVGLAWHTALSMAELSNGGNVQYGDGTYSDAGIVSLAESWAQYIGDNFALRCYPSGYTETSYPGGSLDLISNLIENEPFYCKNFIPSGLYHDLRDATNVGETWDNVSGITIKQMYDLFGPNVVTLCQYENSFLSQYPTPNLLPLFSYYNFNCGTFLNTNSIVTLTRNNCSESGKGSTVTVNVLPNTIASSISVADANQKALAYAQAYANSHGTCITGKKVYTQSVYLGGNSYRCYYHYEWPDGTISNTYNELGTKACPIDPV
jgi:hypothetical protein